MTDPATITLDDLEISVRSHMVLDGLGAWTLAEIASLSPDEILGAPHSTPMVLQELTEVLKEHGLSFRG